MAGGSLISVRTELVLETLVGSMNAAASERAIGTGQALLRDMGWHSRGLELERFAEARKPMPWLATLMAAEGDPSVAAESVSERLAQEEPLERPDPGEAPSWRVPGPGGHVRHYMALRATSAAGEPDRLAGKRAWMIGFLRHCCLEVVGAQESLGAAPGADPSRS